MARLEAASVIGPTFAARIAAAGCGEDAAEAGSAYARLARDTQLLRRIGEATWPDGSASARFQFAHEVFQGTVYDRIPPARRQLLHQRIGEAVERCHAGETELVATELAHHFQRAGDLRRSVLYLRMAQTAEQRVCYRDALEIARQQGARLFAERAMLRCVKRRIGLPPA